MGSVAAWWAVWDFEREAAFISRLTLRLSWLDPIVAKALLFWGLPIGGVVVIQLICYSLDRVFLSRRWTPIDLLRLAFWRTVSPTVALLFVATGFDAIYDRRLGGILWLVTAAILAMMGMLRLRSAEGMKLLQVKVGKLYAKVRTRP